MMIPNGENGNGARSLPPNWEQAVEPGSNRFYYVDHNTKTTTWLNPMDRLTKPKSFNECYDDQLPYGWERMVDPVVGVYYADHIEGKNQWDNPVEVWRERSALLNQHHYSNSHHILTKEQSSNGNTWDSNIQTSTLAAATTFTTTTTMTTTAATSSINSATGGNHASSKASNLDIERSATSLNNSTTLDSIDLINSTRSNNNSSRGSRGFDASLLDIMENRFGRESSQSVEV